MAPKNKVKQKINAKAVANVISLPKSVTFESTPGNPYYTYRGYYAALDADGNVILDENSGVKGVFVQERYEINLEHRPQRRKPGKGMWQISYAAEYRCFEQCRRMGAFAPWQSDRHLGYGVYVPHFCLNKTPQVLGVDLNNKEVKVCQFREGNKGVWHGFPFNYLKDKDDYICDNALFVWLRLGIIKKSDIDSINNREESVLS